MPNKPIWNKGFDLDERIARFTIGQDNVLDLRLAPWDALGSMAHTTMLASVGLLPSDELPPLLRELRDIYKQALRGQFVIEPGEEDVHSQVELMLTRRLGDLGKKIHSGRSRNDQVLLDLKLLMRGEIENVVEDVRRLFDELQRQSEAHKDTLMPGYTHMQVAMPSSFGLWFGAYAESLTDDMRLLAAAYDVVNLNPLGAAAGYGSSFPLDRELTTRLLGFDDLAYNVVYAQMGRGKTERIVALALSAVAETIARLAMDACLFNCQNFAFITLPKEMTTGSSIMPHKKNPDVFELVRAHCNKIQGAPNTIRLICTNLPGGYSRDLQIVKEVILPLFDELRDCIEITRYAIEHVTVANNLMDDQRYRYAYSVEEVNRRTLQGTPFRDAYVQVGQEIEQGHFHFDHNLHHTHLGSLGNLCNDRVAQRMQRVIASFDFERVHQAIADLIHDDK